MIDCINLLRILILLLFLGDSLASAQKIDSESDGETDPEIEENSSEILSAASLAREVVQASQSLHAFDWRKMATELTFGYGYADEANNFDTESFNLGLGVPVRDGYLIQGGLRRTLVYSTPSTNQLGSTPYLQEGLTSRYELYGGLAASLLEGRAMSRLSPWTPDLEFVWFGIGRLHYSRSTQDWQPWSSRKSPSKLGQKPISSMLGVELGFRTQVYLPIHIGLYFEWLYIRPRSGGQDLKSWRYFEGGLAWEIP